MEEHSTGNQTLSYNALKKLEKRQGVPMINIRHKREWWREYFKGLLCAKEQENERSNKPTKTSRRRQ